MDNCVHTELLCESQTIDFLSVNATVFLQLCNVEIIKTF